MYKKILCPIDGSETSNRGVIAAIDLAKEQHAQLCFLHIVDLGPLIMYSPIVADVFDTIRQSGQEFLAAAVKEASTQGVDAKSKLTEIMSGSVGPVIAEESDKFGADLIVMGTHGRRGVSRLLMGSDAASVIGNSKASILLVK